MRVATVGDRAVGYSVAAPWFLGAPFLALVYVDAGERGRGIGSRLLEDFERSHSAQVFTSTNLSNSPMQQLLKLRRWTPCGILNGLDEGDPEIFFRQDPVNPPSHRNGRPHMPLSARTIMCGKR